VVLKGYLVLIGVMGFAGASFFFAAAESALFALGKWRARQMAAQAGGERVARLLENPSELLATLALGNTIANGAIVALGLWPALSGQWPLSWTLLGTAAVILIGGEIVPKTLAVRAPERWALWGGTSIMVFSSLTQVALLGELIEIESMQRLPHFHENIIGHVHDIIDGAQSNRFQTFAQPGG